MPANSRWDLIRRLRVKCLSERRMFRANIWSSHCMPSEFCVLIVFEITVERLAVVGADID